MKNHSPYLISTHTQKLVSFEDLSPDDIDIEDIAHALSQIVRWGGQGPWISVAAHSVAMALYEMGKGGTLVLECLLHDAAEAYLGDQISPLRNYLNDAALDGEGDERSLLDRLHDKFNRVIGDKYRLLSVAEDLEASPEFRGHATMSIPSFAELPHVKELDRLAWQAEVVSFWEHSQLAQLAKCEDHAALIRMVACYEEVRAIEQDGSPEGRKAIEGLFLKFFRNGNLFR